MVCIKITNSIKSETVNLVVMEKSSFDEKKNQLTVNCSYNFGNAISEIWPEFGLSWV